PCHTLPRLYLRIIGWRARRPYEYRHARDGGHGFFEQLQPLAEDFRPGINGDPGDVPAWPRQAGDQPTLDWSTDANEDNGDRGGRVLGSQGAGSSHNKEDINPKADQLGREIGEPTEIPLRISVLKGDVLTLHIAEMVQPLLEHLYIP